MTLEEIFSDYIRENRDGARSEMYFFEMQRGPPAAIRRAALCEMPSGKRPHAQVRVICYNHDAQYQRANQTSYD